MNKFRKMLCLILSFLMLLSMNVPVTFAENIANDENISTDTNDYPLQIKIVTDKEKYKTLGIAEITATVTNTSNEDIQNVSAEAVFTDLAPVGKSSNTKKEVETLKAGESISFIYKATLNKSEHKLNFIQKIFLWLVRLFNGGFTAKDNGFDNGRECTEQTTALIFGKFKAVNTVKVWYGKNNDAINDIEFDYLYSEPSSCDVKKQTNVTFFIKISSDQPIKEGELELYFDNKLIGTLNNKEETKNIYSGTFSVFSAERKRCGFYVKYNQKKSNIESFLFAQSWTTKEEQIINDFYADIANIKEKYIITIDEYNNNDSNALKRAENCYNEIISYLNNRSDIKNYQFTGFNIMVTFNFEVSVGVPFDDLVKNESSLMLSSQLMATNSVKNTLNNQLAYKSKIITLQPYSSELSNTTFDNAASNIAAVYNSYVFSNNLDDQYVSINIMKSLSKYAVILIDSHGGNWPTNDGNIYVMGIGETVTDQKNSDYAIDIKYGRIIPNGTHYLITQDFFKYYYKDNDFDNSIIYLGTCHGGDDNVGIMRILEQKGAEAVMGYKNAVISTYNREMLSTISDGLSHGDTVEKAVIAAKKTHGNKDPYVGSDEYNKFGFFDRLWYKMGLKHGNNPAELILTGNNTSCKLENNLKKADISGKVINDTNNEPVANAKIEILDNDIGNHTTVETTTTDENGNFKLNLPYGTYSLSFTHNDYEYYGMSIDVDSEMVVLTEPVKLTPKEDARPVIDSGTCGDNLTWVLYEDGELIIDGEGTMTNYVYNSTYSYLESPWYKYRKYIKAVVVKYGVTTIGTSAFYNSSELTTVSLPDSVISIGDCAFASCSKLESIDLGNKLIKIGNRVFVNCMNLKTLIIPATLVSSNYSHYGYFDGPLYSSGIETIIFSDGAISIPDRLCAGTSYLKNVYIPNTVESIGGEAFINCGSLTNITIPNSVTAIGSWAFDDCYRLEKITINNPNCTIYDNDITISDTATIYGYAGSTAEAYAEKYNRKFVAID